MDKKTSLAILLIVIAVTILFFPTMVKWGAIFHDDLGMSEFLEQYSFASSLQKGIFPLWNPYIWGGAAVDDYSLGAAGGYYYLLWPFYLMANLNNLDAAYWLITIIPLFLHFLLAALGMFVLLRKSIKCNIFGSLVGAIAYIYSPVFVYYYGATSSLIILGWLPWLIFLYTKTIEKFSLWNLLGGGIMVSFMIIAGRPHFLIFPFFIMLALVVVDMFPDNPQKSLKQTVRPFFIASGFLIIGLGLGAYYVLLLINVLKNCQLYTGLTSSLATAELDHNMPLSYLVTVFLPGLFGGLTGKRFIGAPNTYCESNLSGGMVTSLLVFLGILLPFIFSRSTKDNSTHKKYSVVFSILYIFSILCTLGRNTLFYNAVIGKIPYIGGIPFPIRYRTIQCFAVSILIPIAITALSRIKMPSEKSKIKDAAEFFITMSLILTAFVLVKPIRWQYEYLWTSLYPGQISGYLPLHRAFGRRTPMIDRVDSLRMIFDGKSEGEIRYADTKPSNLNKGTLAARYSAPEPGLIRIPVDIPPNKFVWINPQDGLGSPAFHYGYDNASYLFDAKWKYVPGVNIFDFSPKEGRFKKISYQEKLRDKELAWQPIIYSLIYWFLISLLILYGVYFLGPERLKYFLGILVIGEFFFFGLTAFYGTTFTYKRPLMQNFRYARPTDHPITQKMVLQVPAAFDNPYLRIATDNIYYDTFVYLNKRSCRFALMGYGIYPMEKNFKAAIESVYKRKIDYGIYNQPFIPEDTDFLNNFSVGCFVSVSPQRIFENGKIIPLRGETIDYLHINDDALPRVYTSDNITVLPEQQQLQELILGNLRETTYIAPEEHPDFTPNNDFGTNKQFKKLQKENPITNLNLDNPNQIELDISVSVPSMLVFTEILYPGWKASVDGVPTNIYRVNFCQRGMWVKNGKHHVVLEYKPWHLSAGLSISLGTLFLVLLIQMIKTLHRRSA